MQTNTERSIFEAKDLYRDSGIKVYWYWYTSQVFHKFPLVSAEI